jgi:hypothetical protein
MDDIAFARCILSERREKLNQESPLAQKLKKAYTTLGEIKANLDNPREISIGWCIEDVQSIRPDLTDEQATEVLLRIERKHDANIGVNWDVLQAWADEMFPNKEDE